MMLKSRSLFSRLIAFSLAAVLISLAHGAQALPQGMVGWWYYTPLGFPDEFADDPITACKKTAENHMGTPLLAMRPLGSSGKLMSCKYAHFIGSPNDGEWYGTAILVCSPGYGAMSPGVCVKRDEAPPPSPPPPPPPPGGCSGGGSGGGPGSTVGNPVQVASGAKVQTETDLSAGPLEWLRVDRTYRSLRRSWQGQSAGVGWSFSFDREFAIDRGLYDLVPKVMGTLGDGSAFAFYPRLDGSYVSRYDKGMSLKALNDAYDDWLLTTADGRMERYKKINDAFKMVSSHSADGHSATYSYDTENRLILISDSSGRTVKIGWHGSEVESIDGPNGSVRYEYEQAPVTGQAAITGMARLESVHFHNRDGVLIASRHYHYEHELLRYLLTGITDENGARFATYVYNDAGSVVLSEHAGGAGRYTFDYSSETARRITDPLGTERILNVRYFGDTRGRITAESQPAGAGCSAGASALTYTADGDLASSTDFNGHKTCFVTDSARGLETRRIVGLPASASCPAGGDAIPKAARMISTQWHGDWRVKSAVAEPNRITTYVYNGQPGADGQVARCAGDATLSTAKPIAVLCSMTVQATTDNSGALGFLATKTGAAWTWQYTYNGLGQLLMRSGPTNASGSIDSTRFNYYADTTDSHTKGDLASATNAAGEMTEFREYREDGLATNIKRPNGQTVKLEYGPRQLLASSSVEDGSGVSEITRYQYDDAGQLTGVVAPDGSSIIYAYDAAHRLTDLRDSMGNRVHFSLDNMGNVIHREVRGVGGELVTRMQRTYDALSRLEREQRDDDDAGISYAYDRGGNLTAMTDQLGRVTMQVFDSFDRVIAQSLPPAAPGASPSAIRYGYSQQDRLISVTDPRKLITRYTVDGFGQQTAVVSPDTGKTTTRFDAAGNPALSVDASGRKTNYRFDAVRRATRIGSSTFEYGKEGSGSMGRLTTMNDDSGQTSYAYNGFGRLLAKTQKVGTGAGAKTFRLAYTYGSAGTSVGHVTSMTYPSGNRVDIPYGSDGQPISLTVAAPGGTPVTILSDIRYQTFGVVKGWSWGNSTTASPNIYERGFDMDGRIISYPLGHPAHNGAVRTLHYDAAGRILASTHTGGPAAALLDQRYDYDGLDRLIGFEGANTSQRFQYDANGNRTRATFGTTTYVNDISTSSNRLSSTTGPDPAKRNSFDAAGNITSDGNIQYSYGDDGRLRSAVAQGGTTLYRYNGLGQRVMKSGPGGAVHYLYDESGRLLGEYDSAGAVIQESVYLGDVPVAVLKLDTEGRSGSAAGLGIHYVYADHLSTPRVITEQVTTRWSGAGTMRTRSDWTNRMRILRRWERSHTTRAFPDKCSTRRRTTITTTTGTTIPRSDDTSKATQLDLRAGSIPTRMSAEIL
jgi:YD repeat-containing protein